MGGWGYDGGGGGGLYYGSFCICLKFPLESTAICVVSCPSPHTQRKNKSPNYSVCLFVHRHLNESLESLANTNTGCGRNQPSELSHSLILFRSFCLALSFSASLSLSLPLSFSLSFKPRALSSCWYLSKRRKIQTQLDTQRREKGIVSATKKNLKWKRVYISYIAMYVFPHPGKCTHIHTCV